MGADLVLSFCRYVPLETALEWVRDAPAQTIRNILDSSLQMGSDFVEMYVESYLNEDSNRRDTDWTQDEVVAARKALIDIATIALTESRDCYVIRIEGFPYMIAGGTSWGDDPSDSFDPVIKWDEIMNGYHKWNNDATRWDLIENWED